MSSILPEFLECGGSGSILFKNSMASSKTEWSCVDDSLDESVQSQSLDSLKSIVSIKPMKISCSAGDVIRALPQKADAVFLLDSSM